MALERKIVPYRGHKIIANASGAMVHPDKYSIAMEGTENAILEAKTWVDAKYMKRFKSRREPHIGTLDDYAEALNAISLGKSEHAMLVAHRQAKGRRLSAPDLSKAAGWEGAGPANIHYGKLGRRVAEHLDLAITDKNEHAWTEALASYDDETTQWEMHEELALAIDRLNLK